MIDLEKYLIPAMESASESDFFKVFNENDYMNYKTASAKVGVRLIIFQN